MPSQQHHVGRLTLSIDTPGLDLAIRLRGRAEDIARDLLPGVIERTFEALAPEGRRVELSRLELDLGTIAAERLEEELPLALERTLAGALTQALAAARNAPTRDARELPHQAAALEDFEVYLTHGAPRHHAPQGYRPAESFTQLLRNQPDALVAMLRRRARDRHALDRLVLQLDEAALRALLNVLAPADAALILAYHADLLRVRLDPPLPAAAPLRHAIWVLTLEFILREAGTQFNRRSFVAHLLHGIAAAQGIAYSLLLAQVRDALALTRQRRPATASLPGVLDALAADEKAGDRGTITADEPDAPPERTAEALLQQFRDAAEDPATLESLVRQLSAAQFAWLIARLEPAQAAQILAYVAGLSALHRESTLLALSLAGFENQLRLTVLRFLLRDAGSQFNRRSWLRRLLNRLAAIGGVSQQFLLESLMTALAAVRRRLPAGSSLPAAVSALAADLPAPDSVPPEDADPIDAWIVRLRQYQDDEAALATLALGMSADLFAAVAARLRPRPAAQLLGSIAELTALQQRHGLIALSERAFAAKMRTLALRWLMRAPRSPFREKSWLAFAANGLAAAARLDPAWLAARLAEIRDAAPPPDLPRDAAMLAREIERTDGGAKAELIRSLTSDPARLQRVIAALDEGGVLAILAQFGAVGDAAAADLAMLERRHAERALAALDATGFRNLITALAIGALARGGAFRRAELRRHLLDGIAGHQGLSPRETGNWRWLERATKPAPQASGPDLDPLCHAERFLRSGGPPASAAYLTRAATRNPAAFAALLRKLLAGASGESGLLIERLLAWMLPEEILVALQPDGVDRAAAWAAHLADLPGGSMTAAWTRILDAALRGEILDMADPPPPGERQDRLALLRHWLEHGTLAWWAPPGARIESLLAEFAGLQMPEMHRLFGDADPETVAIRLHRAVGFMKAEDAAALIERLAPWMPNVMKPLAALSGDTAPDLLASAQLRAAAAAITGAPVDLHRLGSPIPPPPIGAAQPPPSATADRTALFAWLSGDAPASAAQDALPMRLLADLADRGDPDLDSALRAGLASPGARARWAAEMPEELFSRTISRLAPAQARFLLDTTTILAAAWRQVAPEALRAGIGETLRARLLAMLAEAPLPARRAALGRLIAGLPEASPEILERARARAIELAQRGGHANILAAMSQSPAATPPSPMRASEPVRPPEPENGDRIYIANAGLVLFNPFLPRFFERIGVLTPDAEGVPRIAGIEAASRAVHLLQYLIDERCDAPETALALNKLLAGVSVTAPVAREIEPGAADRAICAELIDAVIANWAIIQNTSPAGLRETFLQREGRLRREADRWTLDVERKTLDILVDQIPWNRAVLYHRWMAEPVHVNW
ncbi:contractile injection system tape measure protein [Sphingomonas soli]|uniref:contractile injection system tape measure protein n=1 Tax=Sphingomonas soli TaxID=266127 RepID=UPI000833A690|nr:contractile injection system tape measure protein [Sphingomonas soli]